MDLDGNEPIMATRETQNSAGRRESMWVHGYQEELNKINQIPQCRFQKAEMFVSDNGRYKFLEELWDGDVWEKSCLNNWCMVSWLAWIISLMSLSY
jgi:hypothetical protein